MQLFRKHLVPALLSDSLGRSRVTASCGHEDRLARKRRGGEAHVSVRIWQGKAEEVTKPMQATIGFIEHHCISSKDSARIWHGRANVVKGCAVRKADVGLW